MLCLPSLKCFLLPYVRHVSSKTPYILTGIKMHSLHHISSSDCLNLYIVHSTPREGFVVVVAVV